MAHTPSAWPLRAEVAQDLFFLWTPRWVQFPYIPSGPLFGTPDYLYNCLLDISVCIARVHGMAQYLLTPTPPPCQPHPQPLSLSSLKSPYQEGALQPLESETRLPPLVFTAYHTYHHVLSIPLLESMGLIHPLVHSDFHPFVQAWLWQKLPNWSPKPYLNPSRLFFALALILSVVSC